jgi:hypothetical protein
MPNDRLRDFLIELSSDPHRLRQLRSDPDAALSAADLSAEDAAILRRADPVELRNVLIGEPDRTRPPRGPKGPKGDPGPRGPKGDSGPAVVVVVVVVL